MASDSLEEIFSISASLDDDQRRIDRSIEDIVRRELARGDPDCMLARIGEFIVRATRSLSQLSNALVDGDHIHDNANDQMDVMERDDELSDMGPAEYMWEKEAVLRKMNNSIRESANQVEYLWKTSPKTPPIPTGRGRQDQNVQPVFSIPTKTCWESERASMVSLQANNTKRVAIASPEPERYEVKYEIKSPRLDDDSQGIINDMLVSLASRGKGTYRCPQGNRCRKGGLASNGDLIVFERNSAFRAHLEKHGRRYKCDIPGCKNRDGFARKDQLNRHKQETVFHGRSGV